MIQMKDLKEILQQIFYPENERAWRYIVPLQGDWFVPTIDPKEKSADWIGYLKLHTEPITRSWQQDKLKVIQCNSTLRLTFIGPNSEGRAYSGLLWAERLDIINLLRNYNATLRYDNRRVYSQPVRQGGENNVLVWVFDCQVQEYMAVDSNQQPW